MTQAQASEPVKRLREWIEQGHATGDADANAASLATADATNGRPSVRTVYVQVTDDDIVFFVNTRSGKGQQLKWNAYAALCFFWRYLSKQVTVDGEVETLDKETADTLWRTRPRESTLASQASRQHMHHGDKAALKSRLQEEKERFSFTPVSRPPYWVGYRLIPDRMEFWNTGWGRMRMRQLFERETNGDWSHGVQEP